MNSWGSPSNPGVYSEACRLTGSDYYDYGMAKGARNPFDYVVSKLSGEKSKIEPCYDVVLVDEAQDLPISYLKLCYSLLRNPKRLVYAYDEMQTLNEGRHSQAQKASLARMPRILLFGAATEIRDLL